MLRPPPPPPVVIPPLTPQQLNQAAQVAIQRFQDRVVFVASLFNQGVVIPPRSPAAAHQEFFPVSNATLQRGETAQKGLDASVDLVNEYAIKYVLSNT